MWIDHLRKTDAILQALLNKDRVLAHPFVLGELAMGNLRQRDLFLAALGNLPQSVIAQEHEVLRFVSERGLFGVGIGYIDAHLLAGVQLTPGASLWTRDKRLREVAEKLALAREETQ